MTESRIAENTNEHSYHWHHASRAGDCGSHWYVAQTYARHEKCVAEQLDGRGIEQFLPLYETVSRWKDRRVRLQLPLFAGYIFIRLPLRDRLRVLELPSILSIVGFGGRYAAVSDVEIENLRRASFPCTPAEPWPYLKVGRRVRVKNGPLSGTEGILIRKKNIYRLVLSLDLIMRSIAAEVDATNVEPI